MMVLLIVILAVLAFLVFYFRLYLHLFPKRSLPILMYHKIGEIPDKELTVSLDNLDAQFKYLKAQKYSTVFFKDLKSNSSTKKIILTFDDAYVNNLEYLPALLKKYDFKATVFVATGLLGSGGGENNIMTIDQLHLLDPQFFEIALHSHDHQNYAKAEIEYIAEDLLKNTGSLSRNGIHFSPVFAYPYGKFPKDKSTKKKLFALFQNLGIEYAVRIGNKVNLFPARSPYFLCRIDVKGSDSLRRFRLKLIFGKLKLF